VSAPDPELGLGDLRDAEKVLDQYGRERLITDEAYLLRGCLYALVSIARHLYGHPPEDPK
jgi:hypothetical protein